MTDSLKTALLTGRGEALGSDQGWISKRAEGGHASENMAELWVCGQLTRVPMMNMSAAYAGAKPSIEPAVPSRLGSTLISTAASGSPVAMLICTDNIT